MLGAQLTHFKAAASGLAAYREGLLSWHGVVFQPEPLSKS